MLIPVIPLHEKTQKEFSLSKQLIQDLDYSISLILHLHHFFDPIIFLALYQLMEILIRMTNFFESE